MQQTLYLCTVFKRLKIFHKFVWFRLVVSKCLRVGSPAPFIFYFTLSFFYFRCSLPVFFRRFAFLPLLLSVFLWDKLIFIL